MLIISVLRLKLVSKPSQQLELKQTPMPREIQRSMTPATSSSTTSSRRSPPPLTLTAKETSKSTPAMTPATRSHQSSTMPAPTTSSSCRPTTASSPTMNQNRRFPQTTLLIPFQLSVLLGRSTYLLLNQFALSLCQQQR